MAGIEALLYTQCLVDNDKSVRMRALSKLKSFLSEKSKLEGFTHSDFVKIWKGLYYCLYNSDKLLVQENLAEEISCLLHLLGTSEQKRLFFLVAMQTFAREWSGIDNFRLNKYLMLFTRVLRQCFFFLLHSNWCEDEVAAVCSILEETIVRPSDLTHSVPLGIKLHLVDVILEELAKVGKEELSTEVIAMVILPFVKVLGISKDKAYVSAVRVRILDALIKQTDAGVERGEDLSLDEMVVMKPKKKSKRVDDDGEACDDDLDEGEFVMDPRAGGVDVYLPQLKPDFRVLSQLVQSVGSIKEVSSMKRKMLYSYVRKFVDLSSGVYPFSDPTSAVGDSPKDVKKRRRREVAEALADMKKRKMEISAEDVKEEEEEEVVEGEVLFSSESMKKSEELKAARKTKRKTKNTKKMGEKKTKKETKILQKESHLNRRRVLLQKLSHIQPASSLSDKNLVSKTDSSVTPRANKSTPNGDCDYGSQRKGTELVASPRGENALPKLVAKSIESNKILKGKARKVKRLKTQEKLQSRKKNGRKDCGQANAAESSSPLGQPMTRKESAKGTPSPNTQLVEGDRVSNAKRKRSNEVVSNDSRRGKNKNASSPNSAKNEIPRKGSKLSIGNPSLGDLPSESPSNPSEPQRKKRWLQTKERKPQTTTPDPWQEPLQEGEVEIVVSSKKFAKKNLKKTKENSNMVIMKTPKRNTRGCTLRISLERNQEHDVKHYQRVLRSNPEIPFSAHRKPPSSVLKPSPSPNPLRKSLKTNKIKSIKSKLNL